jgi:hypothetical protein
VHQAIFLQCKRPPEPWLLVGDYNLQSAGDVEVVKREEDKQNAKEFFNIVAQGNPQLAEKLFIFLIQRFFPDQADEWVSVLQQPDPAAITKQLLQIVKSIPQDDIPIEYRGAVQSVVSTASNMVGLPDDTNVPGQPGTGQAGPPAPSNAMQQNPTR